MDVNIIVPVAGQGKRFGGEIPKQFFELAGQPIILYTIKKLIASPLISGGVIVCGADDKTRMQELLFQLPNFRDNFSIVVGGKKRQDSVYNGFQQIEENTDLVLIHDGARPFVSVEMIERCVHGAQQFGACISAVPVSDTIKKVKDNKIIKTLDRNELYRAHTPQVFKYEILHESYKQSQKEKMNFTDESSLVEWAGYKVYVVPGDSQNIKITTQIDLLIAEKIAEQRN